MTLKETIKKNFLNTLNETIRIVKENPETKAAYELADFLMDYAKDMGSLMYCYEFLTEDEYDMVVERARLVLQTVKTKQKTISAR